VGAGPNIGEPEYGKTEQHPWRLLEVLSKTAEGPADQLYWPKAGRAIAMQFPADDPKVKLKFQVVFLKNGKPIDFPFPLPQYSAPAPAVPAKPAAGARTR
jgi:hypothetical protein